ncbi:DNA-binding response regulator [Pantoea wallisii]|uniref:DNA-binding response regulator n=1 Tax=Pantoea wallisii TaxID=1076551 RepID=A0A1X1DDQ5_9GAMM|nr:response regulator [Pantoea wallisii]ORM74660.1 DNA-binding response regulator [Pantoea wallisii]
MNSHFLILVVEDDAEIAAIVTAYLQRDGFRTRHAADGLQALELYAQEAPALVILDIRMPGMDGWQVLAELRRRGNTPVLMLTASDDVTDKLSALRIGADDYVIKPFTPAEVVARTHAILRRASSQAMPAEPGVLVSTRLKVYSDEFRVVDPRTEQAIAPGLTTTEFRLLAWLMRYPRKVFSRQALLENCLSEGETLERTVDSHISKLRRKLEEAGITGVPESVRGVGYRLGD